MVQIGFTGSQRGMTAPQYHQMKSVIAILPGGTLHHGDCVGADAEVHTMAKMMFRQVVIHPPDDERKRACCRDADAIMPTQPYLVRNQAIVDVCDVLVAAPGTVHEQRRSGTWATIRMARTAGKPVVIVYPNGALNVEYRQVTMRLADLNRVLRTEAVAS